MIVSRRARTGPRPRWACGWGGRPGGYTCFGPARAPGRHLHTGRLPRKGGVDASTVKRGGHRTRTREGGPRGGPPPEKGGRAAAAGRGPTRPHHAAAPPHPPSPRAASPGSWALCRAASNSAASCNEARRWRVAGAGVMGGEGAGRARGSPPPGPSTPPQPPRPHVCAAIIQGRLQRRSQPHPGVAREGRVPVVPKPRGVAVPLLRRRHLHA